MPGTPAYRRVSLGLSLAGFATFSLLLYCTQPLLPVFAADSPRLADRELAGPVAVDPHSGARDPVRRRRLGGRRPAWSDVRVDGGGVDSQYRLRRGAELAVLHLPAALLRQGWRPLCGQESF